MKLKPSEYNIMIEHKGSILLYNSIHGIDSLCKIPMDRHWDLCEALLHKGEIKYDDISEILLSKNLIVNADFDENVYRRFKECSSLFNSGTNLIIMPTEQCNFRCSYCYESFNKPAMTREVVENLKGYILRNIRYFGTLTIDWFGGEPLCAYDLVEEIMEYSKQVAQKVGIPVISTMTTNGYLLSSEIISKLIKLNVIGYQITIDGIEEIHDKQRKLCNGKGTYKQIIGNLLNIKKEIRTGIIRICIRVNLNSSSIKFTDELFDFLKENFEDDNRFSLSLRYVRDLKGNGQTEDIIEDDLEMLKVYESAAKKIPRLLSSHFINMLDSSGICYAGNPKSVVIGSDGTLYKCTVHFNDELNVIGKLENHDLKVDDKKVSRWVFEKPGIQECSSCWYRGACFEGTCPYVALIGSDKKTCPFEKTHISYIMKFLDENKMIKEIN